MNVFETLLVGAKTYGILRRNLPESPKIIRESNDGFGRAPTLETADSESECCENALKRGEHFFRAFTPVKWNPRARRQRATA
jgi:hypothetical protein